MAQWVTILTAVALVAAELWVQSPAQCRFNGLVLPQMQCRLQLELPRA